MEVIQGEKFKSLAGDNIFYCHTHDVNNFFRSRRFLEPFVLVSHNSDGKVMSGGTDFPNADIKLAPPNLTVWFAQNTQVEDKRLIALPIGMENNYVPNAAFKIDKLLKKRLKPKMLRNLAYMNFSIHTNPSVRQQVWEMFAGKPFVTPEMPNPDIENYLDEVHNHAFVISPEGNGTDCHRTWEALYSQTIPIEKRNINNSYFNDLPICLVDDWSQVTREFLIKEHIRISSSLYRMDKLDFNFWKNWINDYRRKK